MSRAAFLVPLLLLPVAAGGCYTYTAYPHDRPQPASVIAVQLNDRGRVAMEGNVGPEVRSIEGQVVSADDSTMILSVQRVRGLDGVSSRWAGEHVSIRTEHVRLINARRFSAGRTAVFVGSITASAFVFVATGALLGGGSDRSDPRPPDGGGPVDN